MNGVDERKLAVAAVTQGEVGTNCQNTECQTREVDRCIVEMLAYTTEYDWQFMPQRSANKK